MTTVEIEETARVRWLLVKICLKIKIIIKPDINIQEVNRITSFRWNKPVTLFDSEAILRNAGADLILPAVKSALGHVVDANAIINVSLD